MNLIDRLIDCHKVAGREKGYKDMRPSSLHRFLLVLIPPQQTIHTELRNERAQNEIFGMCSEEDIDFQLLENALNFQIEHYEELVSAEQKE